VCLVLGCDRPRPGRLVDVGLLPLDRDEGVVPMDLLHQGRLELLRLDDNERDLRVCGPAVMDELSVPSLTLVAIYSKDIGEEGMVKIEGLSKDSHIIAIDKHGNESKVVKIK